MALPKSLPHLCITPDTSKRAPDTALMDLARRTKLATADPSEFYYLLHSRNVFVMIFVWQYDSICYFILLCNFHHFVNLHRSIMFRTVLHIH